MRPFLGKVLQVLEYLKGKSPSLVQPMGSPIKQEAAFLCGSRFSLGESC